MNKRTRISWLFFGFLIGSNSVLANPQGGQVVSGNAAINYGGNTVTIDQSSGRAIINWNNFSIAGGENTRFNQPNSSSAILNRVMDANPSTIYGNLSSNGQVFLINPNGIIIGPGGTVHTGGGFVGSTLDVPDSAFMTGDDLNFSGDSMSGVVNYGSINSGHGDVVLLGHTVVNSGEINASSGSALLGSGNNILLKATGDSRIYIKSGISTDASSSNTGVDNQGVINAASAELKAAGNNIYSLAVNNSGIINAVGSRNIGGRIVLTANDGNVQVGGRLSANQSNGDGGEVLIGGEYQGSDPDRVANARNVNVTQDARIDVSATSATGNGGRAIVWSDNSTVYRGMIDGRAGQEGGDGAFAEVSGKQYLYYQGLADLRAQNGQAGTLLLDPSDIEIKDGVGEQNVQGPAGGSIGSNGTPPSIINASTINTQLGLGDLTIATNAAGAELGNITVSSPITWATNNSLSFDAHNSIIINADITATGPIATLNLYDFNGASRGNGDITSAAGTTLKANDINIATAGNATFNGKLDTPLFRINGLGVGGSLTATNTANTIGELSFASATQMTGGVNIFDSAGGLGLRFSFLDVLGSVTLRTVGDFNLTGGPTLKAAGNVIFEAKGGTFTGLNPFAITAPRTIIYASNFSQNGLVPTISTMGNADFGSDPIGMGNVFYQPAVMATPTTTPTPTPTQTVEQTNNNSTNTMTDTTNTFDGDTENIRTQDNEKQANIEIVHLDLSTFEFEEEKDEGEEEKPLINIDDIEIGDITCIPADCNFGELDIPDGTFLGNEKPQYEITVGGTSISGIAAVKYLGFNIPFGAEGLVDDAVDSAYLQWKKNNSSRSKSEYLNLLKNGDPEAKSFLIGSMVESLIAIKKKPESQLTKEELALKEGVEGYIAIQQRKLVDAAQKEYQAYVNQPKSNLAGTFRQPFPDIVSIATENLPIYSAENQAKIGVILTSTGVGVAGAAAGVFAGYAGAVIAGNAAAVGASIAATLEGGAAASAASLGGVAGAAGPVAIVAACVVVGIVGAVQAFDDAANKKAYEQLISDASKPVDLSAMDDSEVASYLTMMMVLG